MYSSQSTCVEVDWSEIELNSIPLQHMWIEVDTHASRPYRVCKMGSRRLQESMIPHSVPDQRRQERQPCDQDHDVEEVVGLHGLVRAASEPLILCPDLLLHRL